MTTYLYLFKAPSAQTEAPPRSHEEAAASGERWHAWAEALRATDNLVGGGQLEPGGRSLTADGVIELSATRDELVVGGYFVVQASSLDEATELAKGCPIFLKGGTVEVRPLMDLA